MAKKLISLADKDRSLGLLALGKLGGGFFGRVTKWPSTMQKLLFCSYDLYHSFRSAEHPSTILLS